MSGCIRCGRDRGHEPGCIDPPQKVKIDLSDPETRATYESASRPLPTLRETVERQAPVLEKLAESERADARVEASRARYLAGCKLGTINPLRVARCQCVKCERYLAKNRLDDATYVNNMCEECCRGGLRLAKLREVLTDPAQLEVLAFVIEEGCETGQRAAKILRWGMDADFEGTTQQHKLETEMGDQVVAIAMAIENGLVTRAGVARAAIEKLHKLHEDRAGPRQRFRYAHIPTAITLLGTEDGPEERSRRVKMIRGIAAAYCSTCGGTAHVFADRCPGPP